MSWTKNTTRLSRNRADYYFARVAVSTNLIETRKKDPEQFQEKNCPKGSVWIQVCLWSIVCQYSLYSKTCYCNFVSKYSSKSIRSQFFEFFKRNHNLKITRQIDLVLLYYTYKWCNLTNFSSESNLKIIRQIDLVLCYLADEWRNLTNFPCEIIIWK